MTSRRHNCRRGESQATGRGTGHNPRVSGDQRRVEFGGARGRGQTALWRGDAIFSSIVPEPVGGGPIRPHAARPVPPEGSSMKLGRAQLIEADSFEWLAKRPSLSIHGVVTDPPYGLVEYSAQEQAKLRSGRGGVWRIPPSFDGVQRRPLPRFTTLRPSELLEIEDFFERFGRALAPVLVPGAHALVASNPLLSHYVSNGMEAAGFERRGEIVRLVTTMRGGDRPKGAHIEFTDVTVMPRSMWEPWVLFRKPLEGRVQDNLRRWKTGALRRLSPERPFGDVIRSHPARPAERRLAPHPSLKPQSFLRQVVRAILPLGVGVVLDPFAGSGSTLAAAEALGYDSVGIEQDHDYFLMAERAIPLLAALPGLRSDPAPSHLISA